MRADKLHVHAIPCIRAAFLRADSGDFAECVSVI